MEPTDRIDGASDLVVEIVNDSSVAKDTRRLPERYATAGVPELWLVDARGEAVDFGILILDRGTYRSTRAGAEGAPLAAPGPERPLASRVPQANRPRVRRWRISIPSSRSGQ